MKIGIWVTLFILLICHTHANVIPNGQKQQPGKSPSVNHVGVVLDPKVYLQPDKFVVLFKDIFMTSGKPFSFRSVYDYLKSTCTFVNCPETFIRAYIHRFFQTLRTNPVKAESFCHHLLEHHVPEMSDVFEHESESIIFGELWKTCANNSFYRTASYLKPARRVKIQSDVYLEPMKEHSLVLPANVFVPSELGKEEVEILRFIGESKVKYLVESLTADILYTSLKKSPSNIQMKLFEKLFIERPFEKKGIRFPQPQPTWSFWTWLF